MTRLEDLPVALTIPEAAEVLRVKRSALYAAVKAGQIEGAFRVGRKLRIGRASLARLMGGNDGPLAEGDPGPERHE